jgi:serine/threonine-protein kinase
MPRARDLAGQVLDGRYELHAVVGEGAFGRVYRGRDRRLDRIVAVKVIKPWWADDPEWVETFEREAQLLARVSDPGIVQIFDVGQAPEGLYYVAEFVNGESLASRLRRGPLAPREACDVAEQLSRALAHAHAQRIVHRDIKPANVLISARGVVKLGDFGVALLAEGSTGDAAGTVLGTPRYMAPEQARGGPTTPATDIYSVGVVLYEMLAGVPPFAGDSAVELALSHLHDAPGPLPAGTPEALTRIVKRALAKDPRGRFDSGRALAAALAEARATGSDAGSRDDDPTVAGTVEAIAQHRHRGGGTQATLSPAATAARPNGRAKEAPPDAIDATRVAARMNPRRNSNPSARRRSLALLGLAFTLLAAMILGAILLAPSDRVSVPRLSGLSRAAIVAKTKHAGLRASFKQLYDSARPGVAIAQAPVPGARVRSGSTIRVTLSEGPPPVKVPRLGGQSSASARTILASLGLNVRLTPVPAPGVQPGIVTAQSPAAGKYVASRGSVALSVAETPRWRPLTSLAGTGAGHSVPFRISGNQWRVVYRMSYVGTCTFILFCSGPSAHVTRLPAGSTLADLGLNDGGEQTSVLRTGPGTYELSVTPGSDTARWSLSVEDYY